MDIEFFFKNQINTPIFMKYFDRGIFIGIQNKKVN